MGDYRDLGLRAERRAVVVKRTGWFGRSFLVVAIIFAVLLGLDGYGQNISLARRLSIETEVFPTGFVAQAQRLTDSDIRTIHSALLLLAPDPASLQLDKVYFGAIKDGTFRVCGIAVDGGINTYAFGTRHLFSGIYLAKQRFFDVTDGEVVGANSEDLVLRCSNIVGHPTFYWSFDGNSYL